MTAAEISPSTRDKNQAKRKLAAIMFTDMVGYTALGQRNEALALALVEEQRELIRPILRKHNGREVKTMGDSFLVEFPSALDAVRCGYDIQRSIKELNPTLSEEHTLHIRIGVHVGDVVESDVGDISGDAVNVASRVERVAEDGGVCLTRQVYDHVHNKIELSFTSLGLRTLKNLNSPVEVFKIVMPWENKTTTTIVSPVKFDSRRIAILPFANISPDPNDEYFADGLTEELINVLSQIQGLRVIARTSVNCYKKTGKPVSQISQELGVGTILEGSVRKAGNRIRATLQLVDANSQEHEWSRNYDRNLDDIFEIQSDIARHVAKKLKITIHGNEEKQLQKIDTENTEAYLAYLRGRTFLHSRDEKSVKAAKQEFERALLLDSKFARAYSGLADAFIILGYEEYEPFSECANRARVLVKKALAIDPNLAEAHASRGLQTELEGEFALAEKEFKQAIKLNPSYAYAYHWYGILFLYGLGRLEEAYRQLSLAEEADPLNARICATLQSCFEAMGKLSEAKQKLDKLASIEPNGILYLDFSFYYYLRDKKNLQKAREQLSKIQELMGEQRSLEYFVSYYAEMNDYYKLEQVVTKLESIPGNTIWQHTALAYAYAALGKMDKCFSHVNKEIEIYPVVSFHPSIANWILNSRSDPVVKAIVNDPRWKELLSMPRGEG